MKFWGRTLHRPRLNQRGAALALEIIVYLVIVSLVIVAVISGHRYFRQLTYVMHAKEDAKHVQEWAMGQFHYNNVYPNRVVTPADVKLTVAEGNVNDAEVRSLNGPHGSYCVFVVSKNITDPYKRNFWIDSDEPQTVFQGRTAVDLPCLPPIPPGNVDEDSKNYPLCHEGNMLTLPIEGIENGHDAHGHDIIPPIPVENFEGVNWNKEGAKIFANGCKGQQLG